jgi:ABC-type amino acid transport system permease subunit
MKNPFLKMTAREILGGLAFGSVIFILWLVLSFTYMEWRSLFAWFIRGVTLLACIYYWCLGLNEIKRRRSNL